MTCVDVEELGLFLFLFFLLLGFFSRQLSPLDLLFSLLPLLILLHCLLLKELRKNKFGQITTSSKRRLTENPLDFLVCQQP